MRMLDGPHAQRPGAADQSATGLALGELPDDPAHIAGHFRKDVHPQLKDQRVPAAEVAG